MDWSPLRTLGLDLNSSLHGVAATVTLPSELPISTVLIWQAEPPEDPQAYGTDFRRREPRRIALLRRDQVPTLQRDAVVVAPELPGGQDRTWKVDGHAQAADPYYWRVFLRVDE